MYIDKNKFVYFIDIEGLDCSGKETFAKMLKSIAHGYFESTNSNADIRVHLLSFPDYNIPSGKEIKDLLQVDMKYRDNEKLVSLFAQNRKDVMSKLDYTHHNIVIFDRFALSNVIYGMLPIMNENNFEMTYDTDSKFYELCNKVSDELKDCGIDSMDELLMFSYFGSKASEEKHKQMLSQKNDKDANEDTYTQQCLSQIIDMYFKEDVIEDIWLSRGDDSVIPLMDKLGLPNMTKVKIGHTFNREQCFRLIANIVKRIDLIFKMVN